ncbi:MAG TPA: hypothetical protein VNC78_01035 [Actinomycetota bacterium]|nr:hypothetical protein [Actinomycetota bacterium]
MSSGEIRMAERNLKAPEEGPATPTLGRWVVAVVIACVALLGLLILVALVALALPPPTWLQVVLGVALVLGATVFAWLVASALGSGKKGD